MRKILVISMCFAVLAGCRSKQDIASAGNLEAGMIGIDSVSLQRMITRAVQVHGHMSVTLDSVSLSVVEPRGRCMQLTSPRVTLDVGAELEKVESDSMAVSGHGEARVDIDGTLSTREHRDTGAGWPGWGWTLILAFAIAIAVWRFIR